MASFVDVCRFTAVSSGTGDFVVSSAVTGYQTPAAAGAVNGAIYRYRAESADLSQWEVGFGAYTAGTTTLARTTITANSSGGASAINFSAAPQVAIVALAADMVTIAGNTGAFTLGIGLTNSVNDLRVSISTASNVLGADVALNNTANFFTGPTVAQGTSGTWFASGTVTVYDTAGAATFHCKLWDGTTVIASSVVTTSAAAFLGSVSLSGYLASPAGNIRISVKDITTTTGAIRFNSSGESKDSTLSVIRIA